MKPVVIVIKVEVLVLDPVLENRVIYIIISSAHRVNSVVVMVNVP